MFQLIKKMFQTKSKSNEIKDNNIEPLENYFRKELESNEFIKSEYYNTVIDHLMHKKNLNKLGKKLTVSDKKTLGINTRLQITDALVETLTPLGLLQSNPKEILTSIYNKATFNKTRDESIKKLKEIGLKKYKVDGVNDSRECNWCKSVESKEFSIDVNINLLIKDNCKCSSHSMLTVNGVIEELA